MKYARRTSIKVTYDGTASKIISPQTTTEKEAEQEKKQSSGKKTSSGSSSQGSGTKYTNEKTSNSAEKAWGKRAAEIVGNMKGWI